MIMKRLFFATICAAAMLVTSCEKSFDDVVSGDDQAVTLSVNIGLPEMSTRVFADGTTATELQYAVYEVTDDGIKKMGEDFAGKQEIHLSTELSFTLLKNHTYGLVFWAAAPSEDEAVFNSPYEVKFEDNGATMSYKENGTMIANSDKFDAFYAYKEVKVTGDSRITAQLYRPFAQINIGTSDLEEAKELGVNTDEMFTSVEVMMNTTLDLITGEASNPVYKCFGNNNIPQNETFPVKGYDYLAMSYVLVGLERETANVKFNYFANSELHEFSIGSVPVERNYRTNIYGALLTSSLDVNVDIEPDTDGNHDVMLTWDGQTTSEPEYDEDTKTYTVTGADELAWLASQPDEDYEDQKIVLESDLDLAGHDFPAFASGAQRSGSGLAANSSSFKGEFDGNGKTIRGFKAEAVSSEKEAAAFFSNIADGAVVKNVTFENVEIVSDKAEQAGIVGMVRGGATVEGVKVMSGKISSVEAAGGIVGRVLGEGTVKDCENHADVSTTEHNVGGIVGAAYYNNEGMTISGCDNYGKVSGKYGVGGIVGLNCGDVSNCNNYGTSVTGKSASVGGIVGEQKGSGKITGCTNQADVAGGEGSSSNYGCGGIVGWVRYTTESAYTNQSLEVSGCTNEGKHITGAAGVGGIVGVWYSDGECKENTNKAETITASGSFAAGIVGNSQWTEVDSMGGTKDAHTEGLKLTVHDNVSYTAEGDIKAKDCTDLFVYINDQQRTTQEDNTNPTMTTVSDDTALKSAVTEEGAYIKLEKGTYTIPTNVANGVTFEGDGNVVFEITGQHKTPSMKGSDITFKKVKMVYDNSNYHGLNDCSNLTYIDCEFEGQPFSYAKGLTYSHCTFNQTDGESYNMWTYTATPVTFEDCTFNCAGKALLIYNEGGAASVEVHIKNCKFNASKPAGSGKAAIEMDSSFHSIVVYIDNCTAEGFDLGSVSNNSLWNHKKGTNDVTVYVNGQKAN